MRFVTSKLIIVAAVVCFANASASAQTVTGRGVLVDQRAASQMLQAYDQKIETYNQLNTLQVEILRNELKTLKETHDSVLACASKRTFFNSENNECVDDLFPDCDNPSSPEASSNKPCTATLFRCPVDPNLVSGGNWASFGCVGQMSNVNYCENLVWNGQVSAYRTGCTPISVVLNDAEDPGAFGLRNTQSAATFVQSEITNNVVNNQSTSNSVTNAVATEPVAPPPNCPAQSVRWSSGGCRSFIGSAPQGSVRMVNSDFNKWTGSGTFQCTPQGWANVSGSCSHDGR